MAVPRTLEELNQHPVFPIFFGFVKFPMLPLRKKP